MINPKGEVIVKCQRDGLGTPEFRVQIKGPKHEPHFLCEVLLAETLLGSGEATTKKRAERIAAEAALEWLERSQQGEQASSSQKTETAVSENTTFEGPWPIFPEVLAASIQTANSRVVSKLMGESAIQQVEDLSLRLYKGILEHLAEVVELEDSES